jgi:hypothetical protein
MVGQGRGELGRRGHPERVARNDVRRGWARLPHSQPRQRDARRCRRARSRPRSDRRAAPGLASRDYAGCYEQRNHAGTRADAPDDAHHSPNG